MSDRDLTDNLAGAEATASYSVTEAEKAVLSLCMRNKAALESSVMKKLVAGDFVDKRHACIFDAISKLYIEGSVVNRYNVCEKLKTTFNDEKYGKDKGKSNIEIAGGDQYVFDVANIPSVMSALDSYVDVVLANCQSRKLINTLNDLQKTAVKREASVNDIVDMGVSKLNLLKTKEDTTGFEELGVILKRNMEELREIAFGKAERKAVKTGFAYLDQITGGFKPGTVNIIAARPGMGKTALVLNIATNVAGIFNKRVAIFSLEMSKSEIGNRILAARSEVNFKNITRADITHEQEASLNKTLGELSSMPINIDEKTDTNPMDIMTKCEELKRDYGPIGLVIIDYLQLLTYPGKESGSRQNEIAAISRELKVLAKKLEVPVIALSQLNRGTESKDNEDHIPGLADIRDSGAIEQDADCVIFIHRPSYYTKKKDAGERQKIEDAQLIVAKNRHGQTDTAYVKWYGEKTLFFEAPRKDDPQDPQASSYTRTKPSDASSADYKFEDIPEEPPMEENDNDSDYIDLSDNEAFFSDDTHDDLPSDF